MLKETFIALMKKEGWEYNIEDYSNAVTDSPEIKLPPTQEAFWRGNMGVFPKAEDIDNLTEDKFDEYFKKLTAGFYFYEDWKKAFKGSEFLIPVVEEELKQRELRTISKVWSRLLSIKSGAYTLEETIEEYDEFLKNGYGLKQK